MKVLVTGVNGFVGKHLVRELYARKHSVIGIGNTGPADNEIASLVGGYYTCDITDIVAVRRLPLADIDAIINLAGMAAVGKSFDAPAEYMRVNTGVLSVLCDEIMKQGLESKIRVLAISSGGIYDSNQPMPLTEESETNKDSSPYAASKLAMEELAAKYTKAGLTCVVARPFNHIGPGQAEGFLLPDLYAQLQDSLKSGEPMMVGNLTTKRDYTDVRDVVAAYEALISAPKLNHQVYNVCSGAPHSGEEVLQSLIKAVGTSSEVQVDSKKFRPSDSPVLYGDHTKLTTDTGWQPGISFDQTIADFVATKS